MYNNLYRGFIIMYYKEFLIMDIILLRNKTVVKKLMNLNDNEYYEE